MDGGEGGDTLSTTHSLCYQTVEQAQQTGQLVNTE